MLKQLTAATLLLLAGACVPPPEDTSSKPPPTSTGPVTNPTVGGAVMVPTRSILENAAASNEHSTLVSAVRAAGLDSTLSGSGSYTLFAPTNAAFGRLPKGTVDTLLNPANKGELARLLNYHVVPGRKTRSQIAADVRAGSRAAVYTTAAGSIVRVSIEGNRIVLTDVHNGRSIVTTPDVQQANGVMHVVDAVLVPQLR